MRVKAQTTLFGHLIDVDATVGEVGYCVPRQRRRLAPNRFGPIEIFPFLFIIIAMNQLYRRRCLSCGVSDKRCYRALEVAAVDMSNKVDNITANAAPATIPKLLFSIDCEAVIPAANGTRSHERVAALSPEFANAASDLILNSYNAREVDFGGGNHSFGSPPENPSGAFVGQIHSGVVLGATTRGLQTWAGPDTLKCRHQMAPLVSRPRASHARVLVF